MEIEDNMSEVTSPLEAEDKALTDTLTQDEVATLQKPDSFNNGTSSLDDKDNVPLPTSLLDDSDDDEDIFLSRAKFDKKPTAILSDDDDDDGIETGEQNPKKSGFDASSKLSSDSEEDEGGVILKSRIQRRPLVDSDSEGDEGAQKGSPSKTPWSPLPAKPAYKYNSDLFDAELSDENENPEDDKPRSPVWSDNEEKVTTKKEKKKKEKRPTHADREKDARAIHSESQRMVRESEIALPYHRPKQRSVLEFLDRRKKATTLLSMSQRNLKTSMRNIDTLRLLEQKKKEVEEFYKSDSDHEDPDDMDWTPDNKDWTANDNTQSTETQVSSEITGEASEDKVINSDVVPSSSVPEDNSSNMILTESGEGKDKAEEEDLPDLIIERVPKATTDQDSSEMDTAVENDLPKPAEETNPKAISEENGEQVCDSSNLKANIEMAIQNLEATEDKINDSGIHSGESSPLEEFSPENMTRNVDAAPEGEVTKTVKEGSKFDQELGLASDHENGKDSGKLEENFDLEMEEPKDQSVKSDAVSSSKAKDSTPKFGKLASKLTNLDLSKIAMSTPKLSGGGEDDFIDLDDESSTTPKAVGGIFDLMDRFVKHSNTKRKPKEKQQVNISIVSKEKDFEGKEKLVSSNLVVNVDDEEEEKVRDPIPGARMVLLKSALKSKIREKREQERIRRVKEKQFMETEQVMEDYYDDGALPDEEEFSERSDTEYETESEPEENDIILKDKKRKKSAYFDDEAEEDEDEDDGEDEDDQAQNEREEDTNDVPVPEDDDSNDTVDLHNQKEKDGDAESQDADDDLKLQWEDTQDLKSSSHLTDLANNSSVASTADLFATQSLKKMESVDKDSMDSSFEMFGSVIAAHQPGGGLKHGHNARRNEMENDTGFLTPLSKSKSSLYDSKECDISLPIENTQDLFNTSAVADTSVTSASSSSPQHISLHLTPLKDSQFPQNTQKDSSTSELKFNLNLDADASQQDSELMGLCSGKFSATEPSNKMNDLCDDDLPPTQDINDLMGLCSGRFNSQANEKDGGEFKMPPAFSDLAASQDKANEGADEDELLDLCSGRFSVNNKDESSKGASTQPSLSDEHSLGEGKEEEDDESTVAEPTMIIDSSDDDERGKAGKAVSKKLKRKRRRIIAFSDDEDAQDAVDYDEEENEIQRTTFSGFKDKLKGGIRSDFLENEAELSGSDAEGMSDDEEVGADDLELEEGDLEHYDENDLRDQVGRAHLKSLIDADQRELRLLQEMYLEDGEFHGEGRQRKFRWKNVDADDDDNDNRLKSDDELEEEDPEDAAWRKERFEREKFLNEQKQKEEEKDAEVFKVNKTLLRSNSVVTEPKREPLKEANPAPNLAAAIAEGGPKKNPYSIMVKRGSFLSRDKNTLARIAELTKEKGSGGVGTAKQSGNFVFQQLSAEEVQQKEESAKRPNRSQSLPVAKRMKKDRSFFSMDPNSQSSSIFSQII